MDLEKIYSTKTGLKAKISFIKNGAKRFKMVEVNSFFRINGKPFIINGISNRENEKSITIYDEENKTDIKLIC